MDKISSRWRRPEGRASKKRKLASLKAMARWNKEKEKCYSESAVCSGEIENMDAEHQDEFNASDWIITDIHSEANESGKEEPFYVHDNITIEKDDEDHCNPGAFQTADLQPVVVIKRENIVESVNGEQNTISSDDSVQILRRSLRIQQIKARRDEANVSSKNMVPQKNPISCNARETYKRAKSVKKRNLPFPVSFPRCNEKKKKCDKRNISNRIDVDEEGVPKCVRGILNQNGMDMVLIEWQNGRRSYVPRNTLTERMNNLIKAYLSSMLQDFSNDSRPSVRLQDETASRSDDLEANHDLGISHTSSCSLPTNSANDIEINGNNLKQEKSSIKEFKRLQMLCMGNPHLFSDLGLNDPEIDIKLEL